MSDRAISDRVNEGCYRLFNLQNHRALDVDSGGLVSVRDRSDAIDNLRRQRWLIAKTPGDTTYLVVNLFYGVLLTANEVDSGRVRGIPSSIIPSVNRWSFKESTDRGWSLYWRRDTNKVLDCEEGRNDGKILVYQDHKGDNQHWNLEGRPELDDERRYSFAQWMKYAPDHTKLSMLNHVGTHQSVALLPFGFVDSPRCQERSPYEQLMDGVRYLDCRFSRVRYVGLPDGLVAKHGLAPQSYGWLAVLLNIQVFLRRFRSETVTLAVSLNNDATDKDVFWTDFNVWWEHNPDLLYTYPRQSTDSDGGPNNPRSLGHKTKSDVSLGEARGKLILLVSSSQIDGVHGSTVYATDQAVWAGINYPNGVTIPNKRSWSADKDTGSGSGYWVEKYNDAADVTEAAKKDDDPRHIYSVSWNMSSLGSYNPTDALNNLKPHIHEFYKSENIRNSRIGSVTFDFYNQLEGAVANIIRTNVGCNNL